MKKNWLWQVSGLTWIKCHNVRLFWTRTKNQIISKAIFLGCKKRTKYIQKCALSTRTEVFVHFLEELRRRKLFLRLIDLYPWNHQSWWYLSGPIYFIHFIMRHPIWHIFLKCVNRSMIWDGVYIVHLFIHDLLLNDGNGYY